jgi:hypothetical protein
MINQELVDYVKQSHEAGTLSHHIKISLEAKGWQEADILEAFKIVGIEYCKTIPIPTPTPNPSGMTSATTPITAANSKPPVPVSVMSVIMSITGVFLVLSLIYAFFMSLLIVAMGGGDSAFLLLVLGGIYLAMAFIIKIVFASARGLRKGQNFGRFATFFVAFTLMICTFIGIPTFDMTTLIVPLIGSAICVSAFWFLFSHKEANHFFEVNSTPGSLNKNKLITTIACLVVFIVGMVLRFMNELY